MTYVSVISSDSVRLALLIAALDDLYILAGDIHNKYLNAPKKEKVFFYTGYKWKSDQGKVLLFLEISLI